MQKNIYFLILLIYVITKGFPNSSIFLKKKIINVKKFVL